MGVLEVMEDLKDPWENLVSRLIELLSEDQALHDSVVRAIDAHAIYELSRAEHERALADRARASPKGHSASDEVAVAPGV